MAKAKNGVTPKHGFAYGSRGDYAVNKGWLLPWHIQWLEGGKAFPTLAIAGLENYPEDTKSAPIPEEGYISSGGLKDIPPNNFPEMHILNYTDSELQSKKQEIWPKTKVSSGQEFEINWTYNAPHVTRGYNYWITKDGWNPAERITINQLEPKPFFMKRYTPPLKYGEAPTQTTVTLPQKIGYHVMIVPWIVADTGMAFYQTFDLDFDGVAVPGPTLEIIPQERTVKKGEVALFNSNAQGGEKPFTYLWNLPSGLTSRNGRLNEDEIEYTTDNVVGTQTFDITCKVTDANAQTVITHAILIVQDVSSPNPTLKIEPIQQNVKKGINALFTATATGEGPFSYSWNLPALLESPDISHNMYHITYTTDQVVSTQVFNITCKVTDKNGKSSEVSNAILTVEATTSPQPGECIDQEAACFQLWDAKNIYRAITKVNYKDLVWHNNYYINANEAAPDKNIGWTLVSNVALKWNVQDAYSANSFVNHNDSQWKASYYANKGTEPGSVNGGMWQNKGPADCTPVPTRKKK